MDRKTRKLLKRLQHKDPKARYEAVLALGKTGNTELIEALDKVATLDEHAKVRELAGKAVRTLNTLQQREEAKKKAALKAQMSQEKFDWPTLAQERMLKQRDLTLTDEEWNYEKRLQKVREEKEN
ncbi:MAG: HEAT repeat domain-containing protein, partial [Anaerolineae bacterium]|nr:HEAT repeat domain-containing protein [Anaerolineae bacterium]